MKANAVPDADATNALAPAIAAMMNAVHSDAATAAAAVDADSASRLGRARADAATILAGARADGAAVAQHATTATVIAAKREGREAILGAQRRAYDALRHAVRSELARVIDSPNGVALVARLEALARERLGPNAIVERLDDGRVGVRATDGSRSIDVPVDRFIDREIAACGDRIAALWR
jgi:vacuolar-type H+-ATPase subunit E/Vma4